MPGFRFRHFVRDENGAISIVAALSLFLLLAIAAIVIDVGSLYFQRRNLQAVNDAAALAAVQDPANAQAVASDVFARNGYSDETLTVTTGVYTADESLSVEARFAPGSSSVNAVRVSASRRQKNYLAVIFGFSRSTLAVVSTATRLPTISFGAGTRLASLDGGIANNLLGQMLGSSVNLSAIDYNALLDTNIDALTFLNNLAAIVNVSGSYQQLASTNVSMGQILQAMTETLDTSGKASGDPANAALAVQGLGTPTNTATVPLSQILDLSPLENRSIGGVGEVDGTGAQVNAMSILSASARTVSSGQLINLGSSLTIPVTNSTVTAELAVGAPFAQISDASVGVSIRTAQIRMAITATVSNVKLGLLTVKVAIPIYLEAAYGQATVSALPCTVGGTLAEITATSGAVSVQFGTANAPLQDFSTAETVTPDLGVTILGITVPLGISGAAPIASAGPTTLSFTQADIDAGTIKSVSSGNGMPFTALGESNLTLDVGSTGIPSSALGSLVSGVVGQLDAPVGQLLTTLGITLGIIDVRVFSASCRTPTLVE